MDQAARAKEIVDVSGRRVERRQQLLLRVGVPILGVVLVVASILGIALYSYQSNRQGALMLSEALLNGLQGRIEREVTTYLGPATQAALIARDMVARNAVTDGQVAIEGFAASMLNQVSNLEAFYIADGEGNFTMVRRDPAGGTDTKLIVNAPGARQVSLTHLDDAGHVLDRRFDTADTFDPRTRVWFKGALDTDGVYWSSPYVFFTTKKPGITASIRFTQSGSLDRVFGVDITLEALSSFLGSLQIGRTGRAAIVTRTGAVIAVPGLGEEAVPDPATAADATHTDSLDGSDLKDPALQAAFDRFRVQGFGSYTLTSGASRVVAVASHLPAAGADWVLLIVVPQADFTNYADATSRQNLLLSLITIGLATLLGLLLIRQNRRADQMRRALARQQESGARETRALATLAARPGLFDPDQPAPSLTESLADITAARRASIWRLAGDGRILHCEDAFERGGGHVEGLELSRSEVPRFFEYLDGGEPLDAVDAAVDSRTSELHRLLMRPFGSRTLSVRPVHGPDGLVGLVTLEDPRVDNPPGGFTQAVSSIVAMRQVREQQESAAAEPAPEPAGAAPVAAEGDEAFSSALATAVDPADVAAAVFPATMAMVLRFNDAVSLARPDQQGMTALADDIARAMQEIAARHSLPYMKLTGHDLVAAAGCCTAADAGAAVRLADAALAARDACLRLLATAGVEPVFAIGIDYGLALGAVLGDGPRVFNLWGEAIRTAELMAGTAAEGGSIQVSERAYQQLQGGFLFRPRGVFFVPGAGTARTFVLAGRR